MALERVINLNGYSFFMSQVFIGYFLLSMGLPILMGMLVSMLIAMLLIFQSRRNKGLA